jgi:capsular polysaccharide biosynthesis protein
MLGWGGVLQETLLRTRRLIDGPVVVLPDTGYYHWLLEALPSALHSYAVEPDASLLVGNHPAPYVEQALEMPVSASRVVRSNEPVRISSLVLCAINPFSGFVPPEDIDVLRQTFLSAFAEPMQASRDIYVSRRGNSRSPANEHELERAFAAIGFDIVHAHQLTFAEQVRTFSEARAIAGPHGAGLANQVWGRSLEGLAEVFSPGYFNDCFARLALSPAASYKTFWCDRAGQSGDVAPIDQILDELRAPNASPERRGRSRER